ncbi:MAG: heavy-metal-associated domain-containing protein [Bacteroidota bacterium]|jgi:copper chaperone|nr:heavy-metal-associated domain-containing protein [Bacteroidota bacterium]
MKTETLRIEGMTCNHCVMAVRRQLAGVDHLTVDEVAVGHAVVTYDETQVPAPAIDAAVTAAGFRVIGRE